MPTQNKQTPTQAANSSCDGFTLLETVVALLILSTALLGLASAIGYALMVSNSGRGVTNTKLLVVSVLEQMETLRNNGQLRFSEIANAGQVTGGTFPGFPNGFVAVSSNPGPDAIFGTADDLIDPGPDKIYGTADDFTNTSLARAGYTREIVITNLSSSLKRIQVTLRYSPNGGQQKELVGVSYLNDNARSNFIR
ncbi:MAG TPA: prepilin-type N-terminal cleavage/methylation domain-containing protein [Pyrinomonadaceae bacterium]|nr:prepilin-type N-terminal cleavage/methylation domain-containing protein [Pyrinomonadaceae bacterium]